MTYIELYEQYLTTMKSKYLPDGIDKLFELYKQELVDEQQILNILQGFKQAYTLASAQISRWTDETNLYVVWTCTSQACHELLKALQAFEPRERNKMSEAEKALEKILFNLYEMGGINKQRIKDGFLTDEEEMAYQRTLIFETITAIKNIFVELGEE